MFSREISPRAVQAIAVPSTPSRSEAEGYYLRRVGMGSNSGRLSDVLIWLQHPRHHSRTPRVSRSSIRPTVNPLWRGAGVGAGSLSLPAPAVGPATQAGADP